MKTLRNLTCVFFALLLITSCSNDDDTPIVVNEEEVITTLIATLTPPTGGTPIVYTSQDLDGDGPNPPVITMTGGDLTAGVTYTGVMQVLNETETPADNITLEVQAESNDHQFIYTSNGALDVTTVYTDQDANGNPLGVQFTLTANTASTGTLTFTLRHEPTKPNDGTLAGAGGETDVDATFNVTIQ